MEESSKKPKIETFIDNSANKEPVATYEHYREIISGLSGMDNIGISGEETFLKVQCDPHTVFKIIDLGDKKVWLPMAATNKSLNYFDEDSIPANSLMVVLPESLIEQRDLDELNKEHTVLIARQKILSEELTNKYLLKVRNVDEAELDEELTTGNSSTLMPGSGFAEFVGVSRYDISNCPELGCGELPREVIVGDMCFTTSPELIMAKLPELIKLHQHVFEQQVQEIGYYDGLEPKEIIEQINSGIFTPVAAFAYDAETKQSGEALAFALFAANIKDLEGASLDWLNIKAAEKTINGLRKTDKPMISMPYVIVSKAASTFPVITKIAAREAIKNGDAKELLTLTKTSMASVNYTPAIIKRTLEQQGFEHKETVMEVTYLVGVGR